MAAGFGFVCLCAAPAYGQSDLPTNSLSGVPRGAAVTGQFVAGREWTDRTGGNVLILTATGETKGRGGDARSVEIYAYHFVKTGNGFRLLWKMTDFVRDCEFDISAEFILDALAVTDLDDNGTAETWVMYKTACRSDVSPATLKLIMHEGEKKYAMRGRTLVKVSDTDTEGGDMTPDAAFTAGPAVFLKYAERTWKQFRPEFGAND